MRRTLSLVATLAFLGCTSCSGSSDGGSGNPDASTPSDGTPADTDRADTSGTSDSADTSDAADTADSTMVDGADAAATDTRDTALPDSATDTASETLADSLTDSLTDSPSDVPADVATDTTDASSADAGKPGVFCGADASGTVCGSGEICCFNTSFGGGICRSALTSCASGSSRITCTGRADCAAGQVCCVNRLKGSSYLLGTNCETTCTPIGPSYTTYEACSWLHPVAAECPSPKSCLSTGEPFGECL